MNLFFADPKDVHPSFICLRGQEAVHAAKVLRYGTGDELFVTDGEGTQYRTVIREIEKNEIILDQVGKITEEREVPNIQLFLGVIKKRDRLEFAVEKAVELGVNEIVLFKGRHSVKENVRMDRIEATILSAMKQSLRVYLPGVSMFSSLRDAIEKKTADSELILADETSRKTTICVSPSKRYALIVGPEGGISTSERATLEELNATVYSLGKKRLRAETAAITIVDRFRNHMVE
ncbi:MAG: RsmE family RNA methyltransferase [Balneolaceae bacterium]